MEEAHYYGFTHACISIDTEQFTYAAVQCTEYNILTTTQVYAREPTYVVYMNLHYYLVLFVLNSATYNAIECLCLDALSRKSYSEHLARVRVA